MLLKNKEKLLQADQVTTVLDQGWNCTQYGLDLWWDTVYMLCYIKNASLLSDRADPVSKKTHLSYDLDQYLLYFDSTKQP
jgi:hypothetical protein